MMIKRYTLLILTMTFFLFSCSNEKNNTEPQSSAGQNQNLQQKTPSTAPAPGKQADYVVDSVRIKWTAFKYTNKTAVAGTFDKVAWKGLHKAASPGNTLEHATFSIDVKSLNTNNPGRDQTITEYLFGKMMETNQIEGRIIKVEPENALIKVVLRMNNHEKIVGFRYIFQDNVLKAKSKIDLIKDFKAGEPFYFLHTACEDKHTGPDGVSKTWPDVDLEAFVYFHTVHP